ncbi:hypothetical protein AVEN_55971-1 [Araneus ventricosus]|uniref:Uncharacterized protein n=1 Tax=Araneus ventricosus TaxID=182803 RepID=A0A4Y2GQP5_ARAVE|nr:hypothetical protein AVEN_55971-1 [Araneus ventricosus]
MMDFLSPHTESQGGSNAYRFISFPPYPSYPSVGIFDNDTADDCIDFFSPVLATLQQRRAAKMATRRLTSFTSTSSDAGCHGDGSERRGEGVASQSLAGASGRLSLSYRRERARAIE